MKDYRPLARETALRRGIDPYIFEAQINQESEFKEDAVSSAGAQGLGQLMPGTAAELGVKNPFDPVQNLNGAADYLKQMLNQFGDYRKALAAYNAGPGTVARAGGVPNIPETINYVDIIMKGAARLRARGGGQSRPPAALTAPPPGPRTDGNLGETGSGMGFRKAADPLVATALAGLLPQADANPLATLQTAFQRLAGAAGTSGFGAALRHAMAPLGKLQAHGAVDDLHDQMSAAIFGTPRRMTATAGSDGAMTPFQSTRMGVSSPGTAAIEPSGNQTLRVGDGAIKVGKIASPGQDIYPTTGPHLDVRIMKNGEYINPEFARSLLQNLRVDGKPLYSQRDGQWTPAYPVTSPYGPRSAPTAGASTYHRGVDYGVPEGKELEWTGGGTYSRQPGYGQIDLPTGERIKLLHTIG